MAQFTAQVFQNEFLPDGGTDVHAIVRVSCAGAGQAGQGPGTDAAEIIIVDTSGSMGENGIAQGRIAATAALNEILDGTWFAVIAGNHVGTVVYPPYGAAPMARMDPTNRQAAISAVHRFRADGGTAMGTWLLKAREVFLSAPDITQRHAILLTDGTNEHETPQQLTAAIEAATGVFQCDCRGLGDRWMIDEVRRISSALLGSVDLIPAPDEMAAEFQRIMRASMARGVSSVDLRVWTPQGSQTLFVKQVAPTLEDLTARRTPVNALTVSFPTGAWADESRDYHVAVRLPAKTIGQEQLAARVQVVLGDEMQAQGLVKATWSNDEALTTRIDDQVARYTGQAELAQAIQDGLAAKAAGLDDDATAKLGRAVQLAAQAGDEEMTSRLQKVVEIEDAQTGTVRLKAAQRLDEMALETASTKTTRIKK